MTELYYNYFRFYDPSTGRYLRADPIGLAGGLNLFSYVQNNPINLVDPLGLIFLYDKSDEKLFWIEDAFGTDTPATYTWEAVSGPHKKGALPSGWYWLTGEEVPADSESDSMTDTCEKANTYKFRLHPQFTPNPYRDGLLIHPDGGEPGTAGCVGGTGCTKAMRDFINFYLDKLNRRGNASTDPRLPVYVRD